MIPAFLSLNYVFGNKNSIVKFMVPCFVLGAAVTGWETLDRAGYDTAHHWLTDSSKWSLNDSQVTSLVLTDIMVRSKGLWLFAFDWVFLGLGCLTASMAAIRTGRLHKWWAVLGYVIAGLGFVNFALEILRFFSWCYISIVSGILVLITSFILLPIWLVWLGLQLGSYTPPETEEPFAGSSHKAAGESAL